MIIASVESLDGKSLEDYNGKNVGAFMLPCAVGVYSLSEMPAEAVPARGSLVIARLPIPSQEPPVKYKNAILFIVEYKGGGGKLKPRTMVVVPKGTRLSRKARWIGGFAFRHERYTAYLVQAGSEEEIAAVVNARFPF